MPFCKLLLNGASHDTKIGCIRLVLAGAKKYKFSILLCSEGSDLSTTCKKNYDCLKGHEGLQRGVTLPINEGQRPVLQATISILHLARKLIEE